MYVCVHKNSLWPSLRHSGTAAAVVSRWRWRHPGVAVTIPQYMVHEYTSTQHKSGPVHRSACHRQPPPGGACVFPLFPRDLVPEGARTLRTSYRISSSQGYWQKTLQIPQREGRDQWQTFFFFLLKLFQAINSRVQCTEKKRELFMFHQESGHKQWNNTENNKLVGHKI